MSRVRKAFEECFHREFPATFEAAQKGEPRPHGDMSNAWWGFKEGYRCALPTSEPRREKAVCKHCIFIWGITVGIWVAVLTRWVYS